MQIDRFIKNIPGLFILVRADAHFTIVAASEDYLRATHTDHGIVGQPVFTVFPDNPDAPERQWRAQPARLVPARARHAREPTRWRAALRRASAARPGAFEERFWNPVNAPVLSTPARSSTSCTASTKPPPSPTATPWRSWRALPRASSRSTANGASTTSTSEAHRILGRERGTLKAASLWHEYPGLEGTEFERCYRRTMHQRETTTFTAFYAVRQRWYEVSTFPAPEGVSVYFRDVTDAEAAAGRSRAADRRVGNAAAHLRDGADSTPDFVYVFDLDHRALYANEALLKVWGVEDVRGKRWMDLGYEQWHADMHDAEIDQVIRTAAPIRGEIPFTGTNGTRVYDYIFAPVLGPSARWSRSPARRATSPTARPPNRRVREQAAQPGRSPTARRTNSWPRWRTSCATRSRRSATALQSLRRVDGATPTTEPAAGDDGAPGRPPGAAGRRPARRVPHQPRQDRAAQERVELADGRRATRSRPAAR